MSPENIDKLKAEFPVLFQRPCGFWCEDGWFDAIHDLAVELTEIAARDGQEIVASQVKEKFGGLRFYLEHRRPPDMLRVIREAERKSYATCELTGKPGALCVNTFNWYRTLAPDVAERLGYHPAPKVEPIDL